MRLSVRKYRRTIVPSFLEIFFALLSVLILVTSAHALDYGSDSSRPQHILQDQGVFVFRQGPNGEFICEQAKTEDIRALSKRSDTPVRLTSLPSLNAPQDLTGLRIILRATDQLLANPDATMTFRRAAARWERVIKTPVTVIIDVDFGPLRFGIPYPSQNILGSASSAVQIALRPGTQDHADVNDVVQALKNNHFDDAQLQSLYDAIPIPTPTTAFQIVGNDTLPANLVTAIGGMAVLQMQGFLPANTDPDPDVNPFGYVPNIGFNANFDFDFDPTNGIDLDAMDFDGIVVHEIGHNLGFLSVAEGMGGPPDNYFYVWDLFRVRPDSVVTGELTGFSTTRRVVTPGPPDSDTLVVENDVVYYKATQGFFEGFRLLELSTGSEGGDGAQASHWRDDALRPPSLGDERYIGIMDPNVGYGQRMAYKDNDLRMLEVIGWDIDYAPEYATISVTLGLDTLDITSVVDSVDFGDLDPGVTSDTTFTLTNISLDNMLEFEAQVVMSTPQPEEATAEVTIDVSDGSLTSGANSDITLSVGNAPQRGLFDGTLRIMTNDNDYLVIDIPFKFSVGGAIRPQIVVTPQDLGDFGDLVDDASAMRTITLFNQGNVDLDYRISTSISTRAIPFNTSPDALPKQGSLKTKELYESGFHPFFTADAVKQNTVLLETDFETDFGGFTPSGILSEDWQRITIGRAELDGHSKPTAVYYGHVYKTDGTVDSLRYQNDASTMLVSPALDLSAVAPTDMVVLTFNYFLLAEEGYDFASVVYSLDGGETYEEAATSNNGILQNVTAWQSALVEMPILSGNSDVRIAFRFTSDTYVIDEGWYIDDVQLSVLEGQNPIFTTPQSGIIPDQDSFADVIITVNSAPLTMGFYEGIVHIRSNDRFNPQINLPLTFTVDTPEYPSLNAAEIPISFSITEGDVQEKDVAVTNAGYAPLTFVRLSRPALDRYDYLSSQNLFDEAENRLLNSHAEMPADIRIEAARSDRIEKKADLNTFPMDDGDSLFSAELPGANLCIGITQVPDGRILVTDANVNGQTFLLTETLDLLATIPGILPDGLQMAGAAYNKNTQSLWFIVLQTGEVFEQVLNGNQLIPTGRHFYLTFPPADIAYSDELDALFIVDFFSHLTYALDTNGNVLPGYPIDCPIATNIPSVTITGGVVEIGRGYLSFQQVDQFGRDYQGSVVTNVDPNVLAGSNRIDGLLRSRKDPNGIFYYVADPVDDVVRVVAVDPVDLPLDVISVVKAGGPLWGEDVSPNDGLTLSLKIDAADVPQGALSDTVSFIQNNPNQRVVRLPVEIVINTVMDDGPVVPQMFALNPNYPNPFNPSTTLNFSLPEKRRITLKVFNDLGQEVAVLLDKQDMSSGTHHVTFDADGLSSGMYLVRLEAGDKVVSQRIILLK